MTSPEDFEVGKTYKVSLSDCCVETAFTATLEAVYFDDDLDPLTNESIGYPSPRTYWSNGVVADGDVELTPTLSGREERAMQFSAYRSHRMPPDPPLDDDIVGWICQDCGGYVSEWHLQLNKLCPGPTIVEA